MPLELVVNKKNYNCLDRKPTRSRLIYVDKVIKGGCRMADTFAMDVTTKFVLSLFSMFAFVQLTKCYPEKMQSTKIPNDDINIRAR